LPKIKFDFLSLWMTALVFFDGSGTALATITAALAHELGHITVIGLNGIGIREIGVTPYGFEIVQKRPCKSFFEQISVSLAGCAFNFILGIALYGCGGFCAKIAFASITLGLLNIMPIACLDGGEAFEALLSCFLLPDTAFRICRIISFVTLFLLWLPAVYIFMFSGYNYSLFIICVWLFGKLFAPFRIKNGL